MLGRNGSLKWKLGPELRQVLLSIPSAHEVPKLASLTAIAAFKIVMLRPKSGGHPKISACDFFAHARFPSIRSIVRRIAGPSTGLRS
jgi:hypothetical protein